MKVRDLLQDVMVEIGAIGAAESHESGTGADRIRVRSTE
jgi:hypothetical protein